MVGLIRCEMVCFQKRLAHAAKKAVSKMPARTVKHGGKVCHLYLSATITLDANCYIANHCYTYACETSLGTA